MRANRKSLVGMATSALLAASALGAAAQSPASSALPVPDPMGAASFTGWNRFDGHQVKGSVGTGGHGIWQYRGETWESITIEATDPRLTGTMSIAWDEDSYQLANGRAVGVLWGTYRIENENGAWTGLMAGPVFFPGGTSFTTSWLEGEGAYAGLSAFLHAESTGEINGVIIPGGPPETR